MYIYIYMHVCVSLDLFVVFFPGKGDTYPWASTAIYMCIYTVQPPKV